MSSGFREGFVVTVRVSFRVTGSVRFFVSASLDVILCPWFLGELDFRLCSVHRFHFRFSSLCMVAGVCDPIIWEAREEVLLGLGSQPVLQYEFESSVYSVAKPYLQMIKSK